MHLPWHSVACLHLRLTADLAAGAGAVCVQPHRQPLGVAHAYQAHKEATAQPRVTDWSCDNGEVCAC